MAKLIKRLAGVGIAVVLLAGGCTLGGNSYHVPVARADAPTPTPTQSTNCSSPGCGGGG